MQTEAIFITDGGHCTTKRLDVWGLCVQDLLRTVANIYRTTSDRVSMPCLSRAFHCSKRVSQHQIKSHRLELIWLLYGMYQCETKRLNHRTGEGKALFLPWLVAIL